MSETSIFALFYMAIAAAAFVILVIWNHPSWGLIILLIMMMAMTFKITEP